MALSLWQWKSQLECIALWDAASHILCSNCILHILANVVCQEYFIHKICILGMVYSTYYAQYASYGIPSDTLWRRILPWSATAQPTLRLPTSRITAGTCGHEEGCENEALLTACDDVCLILIVSGDRCCIIQPAVSPLWSRHLQYMHKCPWGPDVLEDMDGLGLVYTITLKVSK